MSSIESSASAARADDPVTGGAPAGRSSSREAKARISSSASARTSRPPAGEEAGMIGEGAGIDRSEGVLLDADAHGEEGGVGGGEDERGHPCAVDERNERE